MDSLTVLNIGPAAQMGGFCQLYFYRCVYDMKSKKLELVRLAVAVSPLYIICHVVIIIYLFVYSAKRLDPEFHVVPRPLSLKRLYVRHCRRRNIPTLLLVCFLIVRFNDKNMTGVYYLHQLTRNSFAMNLIVALKVSLIAVSLCFTFGYSHRRVIVARTNLIGLQIACLAAVTGTGLQCDYVRSYSMMFRECIGLNPYRPLIS